MHLFNGIKLQAGGLQVVRPAVARFHKPLFALHFTTFFTHSFSLRSSVNFQEQVAFLVLLADLKYQLRVALLQGCRLYRFYFVRTIYYLSNTLHSVECRRASQFVFVYVCVCALACSYVYVCIYIYIHKCMFVCVNVCKCVRVYVMFLSL